MRVNQRGEFGMFNFGGTIEEIKARCKAETHLDPAPATDFQPRLMPDLERPIRAWANARHWYW